MKTKKMMTQSREVFKHLRFRKEWNWNYLPLTIQRNIPFLRCFVYSIRSSKLPTLTLPDRREDLKDSYHCESDIFEDIDVQLTFPGGDLRILRVKMGETVQGIKRHIETNFGIPYTNSALYLDGKHMLDPLSLNDFPSIAQKQTTSLEVRVRPTYSFSFLQT